MFFFLNVFFIQNLPQNSLSIFIQNSDAMEIIVGTKYEEKTSPK